jgi:uncharacterized protein YwqG
MPPLLSADQVQALQALIDKHDLAAYGKRLHKAARPCVHLGLGRTGKRPRQGTSRLGGLPDLPPEIDYPQEDDAYLLFVGQINLAEVPPTPPLPASGLLYFFIEDAEMADEVFHAVRFYDGDPSRLQRAALPRDPEFLLDELRLATPVGLTFARGISLPDYYDDWTAAHFEDDDEALDRYIDLLDELRKGQSAGQLLGYPRLAHEDGLSQGLVLLLELRSHEEMVWWDDGFLQVFVAERDLKKRNFVGTEAQIYTS